MIVASTPKGVIGIGDEIPWKAPEDLRFFRSQTMGNPVVMGRKTSDSIRNLPLMGRPTIVLTRNPKTKEKLEELGNICCSTVVEVLLLDVVRASPQLWICGGARVYDEFMKFADHVYQTIYTGVLTKNTDTGEPASFFSFPDSSSWNFQVVDKQFKDPRLSLRVWSRRTPKDQS